MRPIININGDKIVAYSILSINSLKEVLSKSLLNSITLIRPSNERDLFEIDIKSDLFSKNGPLYKSDCDSVYLYQINPKIFNVEGYTSVDFIDDNDEDFKVHVPFDLGFCVAVGKYKEFIKFAYDLSNQTYVNYIDIATIVLEEVKREILIQIDEENCENIKDLVNRSKMLSENIINKLNFGESSLFKNGIELKNLRLQFNIDAEYSSINKRIKQNKRIAKDLPIK